MASTEQDDIHMMGIYQIGYFLFGMQEEICKQHAHILRAICELYANREPIDIVTVCNQLRYNNTYDDVGGIEAVVKIHATFNREMQKGLDDE